MKKLFLILEIAPIAIFFLMYATTKNFSLSALTLATAVALSICYSWFAQKRFPYFTFLAAGSTVIAGAYTYASGDPRILITRDTVYYISIGAVLLITARRNMLILKTMFETIFAITDKAWKILSYRWGSFLICAGIFNAVIGDLLPVKYWVTYKGALLIIFACFGTYQFTLFKKNKLPDATKYGLQQ